MVKDLRSFIAYLEENEPGELVRVTKEVSPEFEMSALINNLGGGLPPIVNRHSSPALLFENVKGYNMPVITNVFGTRKRIGLAIGSDEKHLTQRYLQAVKHPIEPKMVKTGPVKDVILKGEQVDLTKLPIATHCEKDVGAFITPGMMFVKDESDGHLNVGVYRHMLKGKRKLGASLAPQSHAAHYYRAKEAQGKDLECAIVIGHHPAVMAGSQYSGEKEVSEVSIAGGLLGEPLELVKCETVDIEVPAYSEIVIEGVVKAGIREDDAPFGEYLGYYGDEVIKRPIMEVTAVTHRKDPIFHDLHNGGIEHPLSSLATGFEAELFQRVQRVVPQVIEVRYPDSGLGHLAYVRMKKGFEGSGKNAAIAALTGNVAKIAVVVDEDIDIDDDSQVMWAIVTRTDPDRSMFFIPETSVSRLDPMSYTLRSRTEKGNLSTKLGIDATKPLGHFSEVALPPKEALAKMNPAAYLAGLGEKSFTKKKEDARAPIIEA